MGNNAKAAKAAKPAIVEIDLTATDNLDEMLEIIDETPDEPETPVVPAENEPKSVPNGTLTPKMIDEMFQLGDGGRTVRRYLRKYFADKHIHKSSWNITPEEAPKVLEFLATKFAPTK